MMRPGDGLRVAMLGTRGVPAQYGGFETCVEEVGRRLADRGFEVVVYCRGEREVRTFEGMHLVPLPAVRSRSLETLSHTGLSVGHLLAHRTDVAIVFNAANAPYLPLLRAARIPVATHVDGLEWQRGKWGRAGRQYYRLAEAAAVRWSDALIADAQGIADYYRDEFGASTELIGYGAPVVERRDHRIGEIGVTADAYHLVVARFETENHVREIVQGYVASGAMLPLVVVGSAPYADAYTASVREAADDRVHLLGSVWDQELLDQLYANARTYLHGHSVGGTNPSLLRAIGAGTAVIAFDVPFNREVLGVAGRYFSTPEDLADAVEQAEQHPAETRALADALQRRASDYDWDEVADRYADLCSSLLSDRPGAHRPNGRRRPDYTSARSTVDRSMGPRSGSPTGSAPV